MAKSKKEKTPVQRVSSEVVREIRQHARSNSKTEVCGVLIGDDKDGVTIIVACIAGVNAAQGGAHVTFTQDTWEHIYKIKDREYPDERIVGWYHSHPGFGVFLSDHDTFIHKNFFSSPNQVAWVYDPHTDEEGCFGWSGERIERLPSFAIVDARGGEIAGQSGKAEPVMHGVEDSNEWIEEEKPRKKKQRNEKPVADEELSQLARTVFAVFSYLTVLICGGLIVWYFLPRPVLVPVPVDPLTGRPLRLQDLPPSLSDYPSLSKPQSSGSPAASDADQTKSGDKKRADVPH